MNSLLFYRKKSAVISLVYARDVSQKKKKLDWISPEFYYSFNSSTSDVNRF